MTVREHLKKAHEAIAAHHRSMAKCHEAAMGKATDAHHQFHKDAHAAHTAAAETHEQMCDDCAKAADSDLNKLVPTNVSVVTPSRVVAVPRPGQQPIAKANVDPALAHLFSLDEEERIA